MGGRRRGAALVACPALSRDKNRAFTVTRHNSNTDISGPSVLWAPYVRHGRGTEETQEEAVGGGQEEKNREQPRQGPDED